MSDEPVLEQSSKTETTIRQFDSDGKLTSETVTVTTRLDKPGDDLPVGMYL